MNRPNALRSFSSTDRFPKVASLGLVAALIAVMGIGAASSAQALSAPRAPYVMPTPTRIQGADRYDQAIKASSAMRTADLVYVTSGEKFADALSTAAVAGRHGAPLLLTPRAAVPESVIAELGRLEPTTIVVVGGPASVSDEAMEQLSQRVAGATVVRIGGADRYEVSRNLLTEPTFGAIRGETVFVVTGANFPDALTASPAATHTGASPVLLVDGAEHVATEAEISVLHSLGANDVHLVGGVNSLSSELEVNLGGRHFVVTRSEGADRYEAGVSVNRWAFESASTVYLASGTAFPDALSGGPRAAQSGSPLYVVQPNCVPASVLGEIKRLQAQQIIILGGPATLGSGVDSLTPC
ncbi:cell wall-binding repeat-containing protein [Herbiconiux sp. CPCC 205763]|uniref:Cell wall-binding repeat-containing protein n=1 Tax=Herbiconiux aconitum TaxID=2970913 RepID=A0ABT2GQ32_9MICO|nr:cell wall-binding repeat-containing protein [Herbiconiux aconitum]MCS5716881.1 cell wall-binding repeat-containing protein [Herbiconiux aconitum]